MIVTFTQKVYDLWERFVIDYSIGELIHSEMMAKFNDGKNWAKEAKKFNLTQEFFKVMGKLTHVELRKMAIHLLNETPNRLLDYSKLTVIKISVVL